MRRLLNFISVLLAILGIAVIGFYAYHVYTDKSFTLDINKISDQLAIDVLKAEDLSDSKKSELEERWFMESNVYSNDAENGGFLAELNINYFTSTALLVSNYMASGIQYYGADGLSLEEKMESIDLGRVDNFAGVKDHGLHLNYYDTVDGISYSGTAGNGSVCATLDNDSIFIIKLDGKPYAIQLTGTHEGVVEKGILFGALTVLDIDEVPYTWEDVFRCTTQAVLTNSAGYGDYYVMLDLSSMFTVYDFDAETGKFNLNEESDILKNYTVLKFHLDENGVATSKQSMFGQVDCNPSFGITDVSDYWGYDNYYVINGTDFNSRESATYGGKVLSLSSKTFNFFTGLENTPVKVVIDLDALEDVVGFDFDVFKGVKISKVTVLSSTERSFTFLAGALEETGCTVIERSDCVSLTFEEDSISNYKEIVL